MLYWRWVLHTESKRLCNSLAGIGSALLRNTQIYALVFPLATKAIEWKVKNPLTQVIPTILLNSNLLLGGTIVNETRAAMGQNRKRAFVMGTRASIVVFHACSVVLLCNEAIIARYTNA